MLLPQRAYQFCRQITWREAKNFAAAFLFLPQVKRRAMYAVYAFARQADDIVDDESLPLEVRRENLLDFRLRLAEALDGFPEGPMFVALRDAVERFQIPKGYFFELLDGMEMDLWKKRYESDEELWQYCYYAASVVGLITLEIFGYREPERARELAVHMGQALQRTNILRDVLEDLERDRIYIPQEVLTSFGVREEELFAKKTTPKLQKLFHYQCEVAKEYYERSRELFELVSLDSRFCPETLWRIYYSILLEMEAKDFPLFEERVGISKGRKLAIALWTKMKWIG